VDASRSRYCKFQLKKRRICLRAVVLRARAVRTCLDSTTFQHQPSQHRRFVCSSLEFLFSPKIWEGRFHTGPISQYGLNSMFWGTTRGSRVSGSARSSSKHETHGTARSKPHAPARSRAGYGRPNHTRRGLYNCTRRCFPPGRFQKRRTARLPSMGWSAVAHGHLGWGEEGGWTRWPHTTLRSVRSPRRPWRYPTAVGRQVPTELYR